jgi:hypothetical protein
VIGAAARFDPEEWQMQILAPGSYRHHSVLKTSSLQVNN